MSVKYHVKEWLTQDYDYEPPQRGQMRKGVILKLEEQGIMIDMGLKRDGFIPRADLEQLAEEVVAELKPGAELVTYIVEPKDQDGIHLLSLYQAQLEHDWTKAQELLAKGEVAAVKVIGVNRGGLLVNFGYLEAFVPASHLLVRGRHNLSPAQQQAKLQTYVGQEILIQAITVDRDKQQLILSERLARQQIQAQNMDRLLNELSEGEVRSGTVSQLCHFGAFVDLGGAEGLIHISELAWQTVQHPKEVLQIGDEIEVYILRLDHNRKRISLSLKQLHPNPWAFAYKTYEVDQLVSGTVTKLVKFGAFVELDIGVTGLLHVSELADPPPKKVKEVVQPGEKLVLRVLQVDPFRQRLGLSLKQVSAQEREDWLSEQATGQGDTKSA